MTESELPEPDSPLCTASLIDAVQAGRATVTDIKKVLRHAVRVPTELPQGAPSPAPQFTLFNDWCVSTSVQQKREYCHTRAKKANSKRGLSLKPTHNIKPWDIWHIVENAKGRCIYCDRWL